MSPGWTSNKRGSGERVSPSAAEHREAPAQEVLVCQVEWPPRLVVPVASDLLISLALTEKKS